MAVIDPPGDTHENNREASHARHTCERAASLFLRNNTGFLVDFAEWQVTC